MGGSGSGRHWHCGARALTTDYQSIDVRRLRRKGLLKPGSVFCLRWSRGNKVVAAVDGRTLGDRIILGYRYRRGDQDWVENRYPVDLEWTDCHFGGQRPWFRCPAAGCTRRVAILYGGGIFACRDCLDLAYPSQNESEFDRAARRADRIRRRLGWQPGILNAAGWKKPKGMHWRTFSRLVALHDAHVQSSLRGILAWCDLSGSSAKG